MSTACMSLQDPPRNSPRPQRGFFLKACFANLQRADIRASAGYCEEAYVALTLTAKLPISDARFLEKWPFCHRCGSKPSDCNMRASMAQDVDLVSVLLRRRANG